MMAVFYWLSMPRLTTKMIGLRGKYLVKSKKGRCFWVETLVVSAVFLSLSHRYHLSQTRSGPAPRRVIPGRSCLSSSSPCPAAQLLLITKLECVVMRLLPVMRFLFFSSSPFFAFRFCRFERRGFPEIASKIHETWASTDLRTEWWDQFRMGAVWSINLDVKTGGKGRGLLH